MIRDWGPDVLFGQVREDSAVEVAALRSVDVTGSVVCIGSAGCTAFALLTQKPDDLFVVDINAAQCRLVELKKTAIDHLAERHGLVDFLDRDARPLFDDLVGHLSPEVRGFWDMRRNHLRRGLNHCGQLDSKLELAMRVFRRLIPVAFCPARRDAWRWRMAFNVGLSQPVLRLAYAVHFLKALPPNFPDLMRQQVETAFDAAPLDQNPYVYQTFFGHYSSMEDTALPIYIQGQHLPTVCAGLDRMHVVHADVADWFERQPAASISFCALSNVLEVASAAYAQRLWNAIAKATLPGGVVCTRSIFPRAVSEPVTRFGRFTYLEELSASLAQRDRSPFCRFIQIHRLEP